VCNTLNSLGVREREELERIQAPTLVVDAMDMDTFRGATYTAKHIPNARLVAFETGGHLLVGHSQDTRVAVREFLNQK
jgi:2-hydroxy-6-oxonona-2,4-dienedioate hydrolase